MVIFHFKIFHQAIKSRLFGLWMFDVHCLLRPVRSWSLCSVCYVCSCPGAVWGRYQSRHRCCDLGPTSSVWHGGKVYLSDTSARHVQRRVCVLLFVCLRHKCTCVCGCVVCVGGSCDQDAPALQIAATVGRHFMLSDGAVFRILICSGIYHQHQVSQKHSRISHFARNNCSKPFNP